MNIFNYKILFCNAFCKLHNPKNRIIKGGKHGKNKEKQAQTNETKNNAKSKSTNRGKQSANKKTTQNKKTKNSLNSKPKKQTIQKKKNTPKREEINVKIAFLGGLNEVGKNMTLYECQGDMILVDCGLAFPEPDMLGVDLVIPDFTYVEQNVDKIKGIFITHGHEDHIGGLAYLLQKLIFPFTVQSLQSVLLRESSRNIKCLTE